MGCSCRATMEEASGSHPRLSKVVWPSRCTPVHVSQGRGSSPTSTHQGHCPPMVPHALWIVSAPMQSSSLPPPCRQQSSSAALGSQEFSLLCLREGLKPLKWVNYEGTLTDTGVVRRMRLLFSAGHWASHIPPEDWPLQLPDYKSPGPGAHIEEQASLLLSYSQQPGFPRATKEELRSGVSLCSGFWGPFVAVSQT